MDETYSHDNEQQQIDDAAKIEATQRKIALACDQMGIDPAKIVKESEKCIKDFRFNQKSKNAKNVAVTVMAITATAAIGYFSYKAIKHSKEDERQDACLSIC